MYEVLRCIPLNSIINKAPVAVSHVDHTINTGPNSHHQDITPPLTARYKKSNTRVQGKEPMVLDEYKETMEAASSLHSNYCIVYMRLGTHSRKYFFDNWESLVVGDPCLNSHKSWLVCWGGNTVKPCT